MYEVTLYCGVEGLLALKSDWEILLQSCRYRGFFNTWTWHYCFLTCLIKGSVKYYLISKSARPVAIFPLQPTSVEKGGSQWRGYSLPRHKHLDLADVLIGEDCESDRVFNFFVNYLRNDGGEKWHLLSLSKFRQRSNLYGLLARTDYPLESCSRSFHVNVGVESPLSRSVSHKHLKNVNRLQRKAEAAHGELRLERVTDYARLREAFETFMLIEASGWKGQRGSGSSVNSNPEVESFYRALIEAFGPGGQISINFLFVGDIRVATQFCLKSGNCWHLLKIGYDEHYQAYGPGNLLLKLFVEAMGEAESGGEPCEVNLVTGPPWAERWGFAAEPVYRTEIYNNTLAARVLVACLWGRLVWRKHGKEAIATLKGKML